MIEINNPKIDMDRIKACIAEEVARYEARKKDLDDLPRDLEDPVFTDTAMQEQQEPRQVVDKNRLLTFHGKQFIQEAYTTILGREPDPAGEKRYLESLMRGTLTRVDILGRLRYSREGRLSKVSVPGLLPAFLVHSFYKIPVLGWAARMITGVLNFPGLLRYIQQMENQAVARHQGLGQELAAARARISALEADLADLGNENQQAHSALSDRLAKQKAQLAEQKMRTQEQKIMMLDSWRRIKTLVDETRSGSMETPPVPIPADREQDHLLDGLYVAFENRFRGTRAQIKTRLSVYLPRVKEVLEHAKASRVLDLGCGRGEWLALLKENRITATGLDLNRMMVEICTTAGLDVKACDALAYLRNLAPESAGVITGFHIVEHLPFHTLTDLLDESFRVLAPGGMVIFETPNPENIQVGACDFYTDPTHKNPIPPHTLSFLVEARGFADPQIMRLHPAEEKNITDPALHHLFTVGQDYAVIGYKK